MEKIKLDNNIFIPMPVCVVGSIYKNKPNFLAIGWITRVNANPPMIAIGIEKTRASNEAIKENKEFSINFPSNQELSKTDYVGTKSGKNTDKSSIFQSEYGILKKSPMIKEMPLSMECKLNNILEFPSHTLFIGEIIGVYAKEDFIENKNYNYKKAQNFLLTMHDNNYWNIGEKIGKAWKEGLNLKTN